LAWVGADGKPLRQPTGPARLRPAMLNRSAPHGFADQLYHFVLTRLIGAFRHPFRAKTLYRQPDKIIIA